MRERRPVAPERSRLRRIWDKFSDYGIVLLALALIGAVAWGTYNGYVAKENSQAALAAAQAAKTVAHENLISQTNHHAQTVRTQDQIKQLLDELKQSAAVIEYEGGVIAYQNGEILAAQASAHATLAAVQVLQQDLDVLVPQTGTALKAGQAEINAYLGYLTCLATNPSNQATCGAAPPLPPTT